MSRPRMALMVLALLLLTGFGSWSMGKRPPSEPVTLFSGLPAAEVSLATEVRDPDLVQLQAELAEYLESQTGLYGVFVLDVQTGQSVAINSDLPFPAASTFKLPMAIYVLREVAAGNARLTEVLSYADEDWEEGTGIIQGLVVFEEQVQFTISQLLDYAIRYSDNIATNMLLRRFGRQNVVDFMAQLGGEVWFYDEEWPNGTTPKDMATYLHAAIHDRSVIPSRRLRNLLREWLANTVFEDRVVAGVPEGVRVEHKIGTLPGIVNDVAYVHGPERPFIISVFSLDVAEPEAVEVIATVAGKVFSFLNAGES